MALPRKAPGVFGGRTSTTRPGPRLRLLRENAAIRRFRLRFAIPPLARVNRSRQWRRIVAFRAGLRPQRRPPALQILFWILLCIYRKKRWGITNLNFR